MKKITILFLLLSQLCLLQHSFSQGMWTQKATFPGRSRSIPFCFSLGTKAFCGTGSDCDTMNFLKDFWQYDTLTDAWTQKADFGGGSRWPAVGFAIGNYGYAGLGKNYPFLTVEKDLWRYDTAANSWTRMTDMPAGAAFPTAFVIGDSAGYVLTAQSLYKYSPVTNSWSQKANFIGPARDVAVAFAIGGKGYYGTGDNGTVLMDFYEYDALADNWTQKNDFAGHARTDAIGFAIDCKGYIAVGDTDNGSMRTTALNDLWQYEPATDAWLRKADMPSTIGRDECAFFVIGHKAYVGLGADPVCQYDFFQYTPDSLCSQCALRANFISSDTIFCTEAGKCISFTDQSTCSPSSWQWSFQGASPNSSTLQNPDSICYYYPGTYSVTLIVTNATGSDTLAATPLIIVRNPPPSPVITVHGNDTLCSTPEASYQWYRDGSPVAGATGQCYIVTQSGTYSVQGSDSTGCTSISAGVLFTDIEVEMPYMVSVYPNPATEQLVVSGLSFEVDATLEIYNVFGEKIYSRQLETGNRKPETVIDIYSFTAGVYFIKIKNDKKIGMIKFIKQ